MVQQGAKKLHPPYASISLRFCKVARMGGGLYKRKRGKGKVRERDRESLYSQKRDRERESGGEGGGRPL